jgi:hypothetical protein
MTIEKSLTSTRSYHIPNNAPRRLPEDASQALMHVTAILGLNDEADIEPGELQGMSRMLTHARNTLQDMRR